MAALIMPDYASSELTLTRMPSRVEAEPWSLGLKRARLMLPFSLYGGCPQTLSEDCGSSQVEPTREFVGKTG